MGVRRLLTRYEPTAPDHHHDDWDRPFAGEFAELLWVHTLTGGSRIGGSRPVPYLAPPHFSRGGEDFAIVVEMFRRRPDAVRVIPGLSMGSAASARSGARLAREGIDCVVDLREKRTKIGDWPSEVLVGLSP